MVLLGLYLFPIGASLRFFILTISSLVFYGWAGIFDLFIFLFVVFISYFFVYLSSRDTKRRNLWIYIGVSILSLHLGIWKYLPWLSANFGKQFFLPLPVGISFFTLQGIAYMIDFRRQRAQLIGLSDYFLFKSFFAQLIAGPIVRANQLMPELRKLHRPTFAEVGSGAALAILGLFKKLFIADRVVLIVDTVFASPHKFDFISLFLGMVAFTVQIWGDFSGYTDIGRGCARMLGIKLPENFLSPAIARGPSDVWKRWHITLSLWFRDYLYKPLRGHSKSPWRRGAAAVITFLLAGLWHGAEWTFLIYGAFWGVLIVIERYTLKLKLLKHFQKSLPESLYFVTSVSITLLGSMFSLMIFRSENVEMLGQYVESLFHPTGIGTILPFARNLFISAGFMFLIETIGYYRWESNSRPNIDKLLLLKTRYQQRFSMLKSDLVWGTIWGIALGFLFAFTIAYRQFASISSFIYFQF